MSFSNRSSDDIPIHCLGGEYQYLKSREVGRKIEGSTNDGEVEYWLRKFDAEQTDKEVY